MLNAQAALGNQGILRLLRSNALSSQVTISEPTDACEREADGAAEEIMRTPVPEAATTSVGGANETASAPDTRRRSHGTGGNRASALISATGSAQPLDAATKSYFGLRFGADLSDVRIHADGRAAESARSINADAYTVGSAVVFGTGKYQPQSEAGKLLLAHELAHVVQHSKHPEAGTGRIDRESTVGISEVGPPSSVGVTRQPVAFARSRDPAAMSIEEIEQEIRLLEHWLLDPSVTSTERVDVQIYLGVLRGNLAARTRVTAPERSLANVLSDRFFAWYLRQLDDTQAQFSQSLRNLAAGLPPAQFAQVDSAIGVVDAIIDTFQSIGMFLMGIQAGTVELIFDLIVGLAKLALFVVELLGRFLSDLIAFLLQQVGVEIHLPGESGREFALKAWAALEQLPATMRAAIEAWQARYRAAPPELKAAMLGRLLPEVVATLFAGVGAARAAAAGGRALLSTSAGRAFTVALPLSFARVEGQIFAPSGMVMEARTAASVGSAQSVLAPASTVPVAVAAPVATPVAAAAPLAATAAAAPLVAPVAGASAVAAPVAGAAALTTPQLMSLAYAASLAPTSTSWTAVSTTAPQLAAQSVQPATTAQDPNVLAATMRVQHGPFSSPNMWDRTRALLTDMRASSGIRRETKSAATPAVEGSVGGNMAVSLTSVEGVRNGGLVVGRSPEAGGRAQLGSPFSPKTDPVELPHTHRHAEQELAERLYAAMGGLNPAAWQGQTVWILVEAAPCAQCMNDVLPALSAAFPGLTLEVKNLESSRILRYRDGVLLNR